MITVILLKITSVRGLGFHKNRRRRKQLGVGLGWCLG